MIPVHFFQECFFNSGIKNKTEYDLVIFIIYIQRYGKKIKYLFKKMKSSSSKTTIYFSFFLSRISFKIVAHKIIITYYKSHGNL